MAKKGIDSTAVAQQVDTSPRVKRSTAREWSVAAAASSFAKVFQPSAWDAFFQCREDEVCQTVVIGGS